MAEYKNRSALEIHADLQSQKERSKVRVSRRRAFVVFITTNEPMRYPAKIAHSGMINLFLGSQQKGSALSPFTYMHIG